jgi:hypothetical protein
MDNAIAASIEATAKEIVAAAGLHQRKPHLRKDLEAGLDLLIERLNELHHAALSKREMGKIIVAYHNGEEGE